MWSAISYAADPAPLTPAEAASGWRSLFGGKTLHGWAAAAKNWEARDGELVRTGRGGDIAYVMYRLPEDYELRVNWKPNASNSWNTERIVCHGKSIDRQLNGAPLKNSKTSGLDLRGCGEFLTLPDGDDAVTYKGIYIRALSPSGDPPLFEEDGLASIELRVKLWKQMEAYVNALPVQKRTPPAGAPLIERFRAEGGYPAPGLKSGKPRLEKMGEDAVANYYRCFIPLTAEMDAYGLYIVPKGAKFPAPLVIAQHGNNGYPEVAMFYGAGNYKDMIRGAVSRGYIVYAPHLVTYFAPDARAGSPIPEDVRQRMDKQLREKGYSLTGIEASRIIKALDVLIERPEVDRNRVAMIGLSLGASTTLAIAALDPRIKVAVASCGFRYQAPDSPAPLTSSQMISAIAPRPLQIQAGTRDPLVSIDSARPAGSIGPDIYGKAGATDRFKFEEFDGGHEFNGALAFAFLRKYL